MPVPPVSSLPEELTSLPHWVAWREELRPGSTKRTKVPYVLATGRNASSTKPEDWCDFPDTDIPDAYNGLGFVFTKSAGFTGIDLDDCLVDGSVKPWAAGILASLPSYAEISPSGNGIKIWARALLPGNGLKAFIDADGKRTVESMADGSVEMYDTGRYFTVTGNLHGSNTGVTDLQEAVTALYQRLRGNERPELPTQSPRTVTFDIPAGPSISEGGRHSFLLNQAAKWRARGMELPDLLNHLRDLNAARCSPPKPDFMLKGIADWFADKAPTYRLTQRDYASAAQWAEKPVSNGNGAAAASARQIEAPQPQPAGPQASVAIELAAEPEPSGTDPSTPLKFRVLQVLEKGVEGCYEPDLARLFAIAYLSGPKATIEADDLESRLKTKFGKDFNTTRFRRAVKAIREDIVRTTVQTKEGWESDLILKTGKDGAPGPVHLCEANALLYFENHPDWHEVLGYNAFTAQHAVLKDTPEPVHLKVGDVLEDHHDTQFARWLQVETRQPWRVDMVRRAVDCWARDRSFHPIRDYLNGLPEWDGEERLKTWLFDYAGAGPASESDDSHDPALLNFIAAAGERWMISAVARVRNPGCEVHHMLVLEGGEGLGKSMLVKKIGKGYSQVMQGALDGRSAQELIASAVWIWEFAELASLKKTSEVESAKAFITNPEETFRPAYGHRVIKHKRECAFIATVNNDQYFDSQAWEDGKRRAWPIRCTRPFNLDGLDEAIDLLWAEADYKFKHGYRWHFDRNEDSALITTANQEQAARVPEHVLADSVANAATKIGEMQGAFLYGSVSISEVLADLNIPLDRRRSMQQDIGRCLKAGGWVLWQPRFGGKQVRRYRKPDIRGS